MSDKKELKQMEIQYKEKRETSKVSDQKVLELTADKVTESETEDVDPISKEIEDSAGFKEKRDYYEEDLQAELDEKAEEGALTRHIGAKHKPEVSDSEESANDNINLHFPIAVFEENRLVPPSSDDEKILFSEFSSQGSTLLSTRIADKIVGYSREKEKSEIPVKTVLTEDENAHYSTLDNALRKNVGNGESVAFQTAKALLKGKQVVRPCVLFDTGSHRTFVMKDIIDRLELSPIKQERSGITTFGSPRDTESLRDVVTV
eukprot:gene9990-18614_t